jgi:hypothetical protein
LLKETKAFLAAKMVNGLAGGLGWMHLCLLIEQQRGQGFLSTGDRPKALFDISEDIRFGNIDSDVEDLGGHVVAKVGAVWFGARVGSSRAVLLSLRKDWRLGNTYTRR